MTYDILVHHGIIGMKWGVRNGPPYPLSKQKSRSVQEKGKKKAKEGGLAELLELTFVAASVVAPIALSKLSEKKAQKSIERGKKEVDRIVKDLDMKSTADFPRKEKPVENTLQSVKEDLRACNPAKGEYNCVATTAAYDLRRRGYDVVAKQEYDAEYMDVAQYANYYKDYKVQRYPDLRNLSGKDAMKKVEDRLGEYPDGARGSVRIMFKESEVWRFGCYGHAMAWQKVEGKVHWIDPQSGEIFQNDSRLMKILTDVADPGRFQTARLDDLELQDNVTTAMQNMIGVPTGKKSNASNDNAALNVIKKRR